MKFMQTHGGMQHTYRSADSPDAVAAHSVCINGTTHKPCYPDPGTRPAPCRDERVDVVLDKSIAQKSHTSTGANGRSHHTCVMLFPGNDSRRRSPLDHRSVRSLDSRRMRQRSLHPTLRRPNRPHRGCATPVRVKQGTPTCCGPV